MNFSDVAVRRRCRLVHGHFACRLAMLAACSCACDRPYYSQRAGRHSSPAPTHVVARGARCCAVLTTRGQITTEMPPDFFPMFSGKWVTRENARNVCFQNLSFCIMRSLAGEEGVLKSWSGKREGGKI